ncbi:uncharacterized protein [Centruroides vittatus]|uniref:uncharacterized protein n=1 Tax=Centruroides vittatus TaxID=120091 RepID=UPI00350E9FAA
MSNDIDDVFDEFGDMKIVDEVSWRKITDACMKDGFRDGIVEGQEEKQQNGFNMGYAKGYQQSFPIAMIRGVMRALREYLFQNSLIDAQEINHITKELVGLEKDILELNKASIATKKKNESKQNDELLLPDKDNALGEAELDSKKNPEQAGSSSEVKDVTKKTDSDLEAKELVDANLKCLSEQFESIKKRSMHILENLGFTELCNLICDISWNNIQI